MTESLMEKLDLFKKFHNHHKHKIAGAFVAFGTWAIIFPEPFVTDVIGTVFIIAGFFMAYIHDLRDRELNQGKYAVA